MRLQQLNLLAFGPFTDVTLDFSQAGLHVVYGPNEAGKSTALRAIHAALFGIPHHTTDNFLHDHKDLRVGACLQSSAGQQISFVRRKGRKDTLLNIDPQLGPHPDHALVPFLGNMDAETFARLFGIDYAELRRGGDEMRQLKGLSGESLFAAGLGTWAGRGIGLADLLKQLDEQAAAIYSSKKRTTSIRVAKTEYETAMKQKRAAELSSTQWQQLQAERQHALEELERVRAQLLELRTQSSRLGRLRDALKPLAQRQQLIEQLAAMGDVVVLPDTYSADERLRMQTSLDETRRQLHQLETELNGDGGLRAQRNAITVAEIVLQNEQIVDDLQQRLGAHLKATRDRTTALNPRRSEILSRMAELRRGLGIAPVVDIETLRLTSEQRVAIHNLASQEKSLRQAPHDLCVKHDELQQALDAAQRELASLGARRDLNELRQAMDMARASEDLEDQLASQQNQRAAQEREVEQQLAELGLAPDGFAELVRLPLPLGETVDYFESEFADCREQLRVRGDKSAQMRTELGEILEQLAALERTDHLPTEVELRELRQRRDHGWTLVLNVWQQGWPEDAPEVSEYAEDAPLAEVFQRDVRQADLVADRLRREAEHVAKRATLSERKSRLEQQLAAEQGQLAVCRQQLDQLQAKWAEHLAPLPVSPRLTPRELRGWSQRHAQLKALAADMDGCRAQMQRGLDRLAACRGRLTDSMVRLEERPRKNQTLRELLGLATSLANRQSETDSRRATLERDSQRLGNELKTLQRQQIRAQAALGDWQHQWQAAMEQIGCTPQASAEQANERISRLEDLFAQSDNLEKIEIRIRDIDSDAADFARHVRELVVQVAPDMQQLPIEQSAAQLQTRLTKARSDRILRQELITRIDQRQQEFEDLRQREQDLTARLVRLCQQAGVDDPEQLDEIETRSFEVRQRRTQLREVEERLYELSGGASIEQLAADAQGCRVDELNARITEYGPQLEQMEADREQCAGRLRELENACEAADGSAAAAEADERGLGILARMYSDAERYLRLRVAAALWRQQIERFRAENQDPLLSRASELFGQLTCREFEGLRTEYNADDQPMIVGVRRNGQLVSVDGMSEGTCDQLYLALRLAYLERRWTQHEPLPWIVDDILINFDNDRARATLQVLAELSGQTQVIFFTHHRHLVEIAEASIPEPLCTHELPGRSANLHPRNLAARHPR